MIDDLETLHRRYDGPIPADERERAMGGDPMLSEARGAVKFWTDRYAAAKRAYQANSDPSLKRKMELLANLDFNRLHVAAAVKRLAALQPETAIESSTAFIKHIAGGI